jgi:hypothetical protein
MVPRRSSCSFRGMHGDQSIDFNMLLVFLGFVANNWSLDLWLQCSFTCSHSCNYPLEHTAEAAADQITGVARCLTTTRIRRGGEISLYKQVKAWEGHCLMRLDGEEFLLSLHVVAQQPIMIGSRCTCIIFEGFEKAATLPSPSRDCRI